ncbi:MAG: B12-binding domain-containing radical SAM protein [Spirochaetaceae bacterium]|nr:B12-binding domain-containing radical SAM protein [Spirochaetaceae bacterium]
MAGIILSTINAKWIHPSLALRLLMANLPPDFIAENCTILEFALRQPLAEQTAAILAETPEILALSVSVWNHAATLELLGALEEAWSKTDGADGRPARPVIVLGGPEVTGLVDAFTAAFPAASGMQSEAIPALFRYADFVIRGEGEAVFAELCRNILENPAAAKEKYGKFIDASPVHPAAIRSAYDLYSDEDLRRKLIYVEASRGCPYTCAFCQSAANAGEQNQQFPAVHPVREFPLEEFLYNMERLLQRSSEGGTGNNVPVKTKTVKFLDRSFNINIPRALRILEFCLVKTAGLKPENALQFHFEMVPSVFPAELRNMLALFPPGSLRLEIGIQSFNTQTCALINRNSNPEQELEVLRFLREKTNAVIHADLIAGLPGEDIVSFGRGFDSLWTALTGGENITPAPFEIQPGILKCLPGTLIYAMAESGGFAVKYSKTAPYEVIETDCLFAADMEKIKNFARFWELIVNRRAAFRLLPLLPGMPVFDRFMELSQKLLNRFGKNWGIPKNALEDAVGDFT